jgi:hypothetical protein
LYFVKDVSYGCKTWFLLTLREEYRSRVFKNRVLRRIMGLRGSGGRLEKTEDDVMDGACSMGEMRNAYKILVGKPEGKRPVGDLGVDGMIILDGILGKLGGKVWTGYVWLKTGINGGLL